MRRWVAGVLVMSLSGVAAAAEGEASAEQLQRMYDNAVAQLRAAQERRNELAKENEKLGARVEELEKRLAEARNDLSTMTAKTFQLRAEYGAFQDFLRQFPVIDLRWRSHMRRGFLTETELVLDQLNSDWPFSVEQ